MNMLYIPAPVSGGILLSYKCSGECKHCMYVCSRRWKADWLSEEDAKIIFAQLSDTIQGDPYGTNRIGINCGIHFTGGEPFLNFELLLRMAKMAHEFKLPSTFVETNCFWCNDDETTREKLTLLKNSGLDGILISVNPFILEQVPFKKTERAVRISKEIFCGNVIIYQELFYQLFKNLTIRNALSLKEYLMMAPNSLNYAELLPMGRVPYKLGYLYKRYPAKDFFGVSCRAELTRKWHIHIDNYCNYMTGYCGGISLGDARRLNSLFKGIDMDEYPILRALVGNLGKLYEIGVKEFDYKEQSEGYISKCHLCIDIRKHLVQRTDEFNELRPKEFYWQLNP